MSKSIRSILRESVTRFNGDAIRLQYDTLATVRLRPYWECYGYVPVTTFALRPSAVELVINEVLLSNVERPQVLELGCGYSTLCLHQALKQVGGRLVSIENDAHWLQTTKRLMGEAAAAVEFIHAPLQQIVVNGQGCTWYDTDVIRSGLSGSQFDFMLVDAPFGGIMRMARYPAYPMLVEYLRENCVAFLDDICRPDEAEIAKRWCAEYSLSSEIHEMRGGIGVLRRGKRENVVL